MAAQAAKHNDKADGNENEEQTAAKSRWRQVVPNEQLVLISQNLDAINFCKFSNSSECALKTISEPLPMLFQTPAGVEFKWRSVANQK